MTSANLSFAKNTLAYLNSSRILFAVLNELEEFPSTSNLRFDILHWYQSRITPQKLRKRSFFTSVTFPPCCRFHRQKKTARDTRLLPLPQVFAIVQDSKYGNISHKHFRALLRAKHRKHGGRTFLLRSFFAIFIATKRCNVDGLMRETFTGQDGRKRC